MTQLASFSKYNRDFLLSLANSGTSRQKLTAVCLGKAIADQLPLVTTELEDLAQYFRTVHQVNVSMTIAKLNELVIIDTAAVMQYVSNFYQWRYRIAHRPPVVLCMDQNTAVEDFLGINLCVDRDALCTINQNHIEAMKLYNSFVNVLNEAQTLG